MDDRIPGVGKPGEIALVCPNCQHTRFALTVVPCSRCGTTMKRA